MHLLLCALTETLKVKYSVENINIERDNTIALME